MAAPKYSSRLWVQMMAEIRGSDIGNLIEEASLLVFPTQAVLFNLLWSAVSGQWSVVSLFYSKARTSSSLPYGQWLCP
ncbi:MAG: hypothetical protein F6J98_10370 [Moorea sp. SIO4G2]|nr:hypothetical protein [Moorena sp. SIO4G2]